MVIHIGFALNKQSTYNMCSFIKIDIIRNCSTIKSLHQFIEQTIHPYTMRIYAGKFKFEEFKTPNGTPYLLMNRP